MVSNLNSILEKSINIYKENTPFPHIRLKNLFSTELLDDLLDNILKRTIECDYALNHCTGKYFIHLENYIIQLIILIHNLDLKEN